ncbi:MAG: hypothetical protein QM731_09540 [Chitinophagaceae bacterium]
MFKINNIVPFALLVAGLSVQSCKKTEYEYEKRPYNEIKQFVIVGSTGDSTKSLIAGDSITVYWSADVAQPTTITPKIVIDDKATISPASGQAVAFNKTTTYTVTAEDGSTKTYRLNPVVNIPTPSISLVSGSPMTWLNSTQLGIYGEHFLAANTASEVKAYMQRAKDGFEFPLELVTANITNYSMIAKIPTFSAEQDTGLHKLFVKVGNRVAEPVTVQFLTPYISYANGTSKLVQEGQEIHSGDSLTINYAFNDSYGGKVASYYNAKNIDYILFYVSPAAEWITITADRRVTDDMVRVKMPNIDKYIGQSIVQYRFIYKSVPAASATLSSYYLRGFITTSTPIKAKN